MSDTLDTINKYVGAGALIVNALLLLPKKAIEFEDNETTSKADKLIGGLSLLSTIVSTGVSSVHYWNHKIKLDNEEGKWTIYTAITLNLVSVGGCLYLLVKQAKLYDPLEKGFSKIALPLFGLGSALVDTKIMIFNSKQSTELEITKILSKFMQLADFLPIDKALKQRPEIYFLVHMSRVPLNMQFATLGLKEKS